MDGMKMSKSRLLAGVFSRAINRLLLIHFTLGFIWFVTITAVEFAFPTIRVGYGWEKWEADLIWTPFLVFLVGFPFFFGGSSLAKALYKRSILANGVPSQAKILIASHSDTSINVDFMAVTFL